MGTVVHNLKIFVAAYMGYHFKEEDLVQQRINQILAIMPKDTKHISTEKQTIRDISIPYVLIFEHPLFEDGTEIVLGFKRDYVAFEDLKLIEQYQCNLKQYEVLTSFKYIEPNEDKTYKY